MALKHQKVDMLGGSLPRNLLRFVLPLMLAGMLQQAFNTADVIVVGKCVGDNALAAVSSNGALIGLLVNVFVCLSIGLNADVANAIGRGDRQRVEESLHTGLLLGLLGGIFLAVAGWFAAPVLLRWTGTPDSVFDQAVLYLRIYLLGAPAALVYNFGAAALRGSGDTRRPLNFLTISGVVNVVLNLFFVVALRWDVAGVAAATSISQLISALLVLRCLSQEGDLLHFDFHGLRIVPTSLGRICAVGIPAACQGVVVSLSNTIIQSSVNSLGETFMAASGAASNIENFVWIAMNTFHQAAITFVSAARGAGQLRRTDKIVGWNLLLVTGFGLSLGALTTLFGPWLLSLFTDTPAALELGLVRLAIVCLPYFLYGMTDVLTGALRGLGSAIAPMLVSILGMCGLRFVWCTAIFPLHRTVPMLMICYPITWVIALTALLICFFLVRHRVYRREGILSA
ncbi:MAG: MATE family efflux transporter [Oscillospiraceae bacterium]|nr:MATE family efflux transporter [Oscillospiraceae bacterium]